MSVWGTVGGVILAEPGLLVYDPILMDTPGRCARLLGIRPNNLLVEPGSPLLDMSVVPVAIVLSLVLWRSPDTSLCALVQQKGGGINEKLFQVFEGRIP